MELLVNFFEGPAHADAVLGHFEAGGGYAAGVRGLGGREENACILESGDGFGGGGHVCAFRNCHNAVGDQGLCAFFIQFVLGCAGKSDVAGNGPDALAAGIEFCAFDAVCVFNDAGALNFLDLLHDLKVDAVFVNDIAGRVAHCDDLAAQLGGFFICVDGDVAAAGNNDLFAFEGLVGFFQHFLSEVAKAVTGCLGAGEGAAGIDALAG